MPRVSIGLPVYNGENFVAEGVRSILDQTYEDFELIISDNASTDATEEICRNFAARDSRVVYYRQARNLGCALNSNFVFGKASGEFFKWISHDDLHAPQFVQRCVETLDRDQGAIVCCPRGILIDETGAEIKMRRNAAGRNVYTTPAGEEMRIRPYDKYKRLDSPKPDVRFSDMILNTEWCLEIYGLMRTSVLAQTSLHGTYHGTDKRILAELTLLGRFALLDDVMLFYRQHPVQAKRYRASAVSRDLYLSGEAAPTWSRVPRIHNFRGYANAVRRAGLTGAERARCYAAIARWMIQPAKWKPLGLEAAQIAASLLKSRPSVKMSHGRSEVS
jgi:glycosyltransferase involved in cell wall biosynthesis